MTDLLSMWWVHAVTIQRYTGDGPEGPLYASAESFMGFVDDTRKLVRNGASEEELSSRRVFMPIGVGRIPAGSLLTYAGDTRTVITSAERSGGGLPLPEHVEVSCE